MRFEKTAFTLSEILIVLVILGVLTGLAVPAYFRTVEQSRSNEAITNLNIIHMGQKIYRLNNPTFWTPGGATNIAAVNAALNTDMSSTFYTTVSVTIGGVPPNDTYTASLTRNNVSGGASSKSFTITYQNLTTGVPVPVEAGNY